jgi:serine/threonine protein kinase
MDAIRSLPGYEVIHRLAQSDMASVWLARQLSLDRMVAIKVLHPALARDSEARSRFQTEARAAARINHPGIVQVYDAGEHEGLVYFVMEYVPGCAVSDLLKNGKPISERNALLIAQGVALALGHAWEEERLIHCDIKPDNILIADDGSVKVADLGLARTMGAFASLDSIEGTPHYCAPEQARGDTDLDCRTDIYSLGATLYHMLTGRIPFGDGPAMDALRRQSDDYLPDPMDVHAAVSPAAAWLVEKMMMKDRSVRHADWAAALADIERVAGGSLPKDPPPIGQSTVLRSERRIWPVSLAAPQALPPSVQQPSAPAASPPSEASPADAGKKLKLKKLVVSADIRKAMRNNRPKDAERDVAREWLYMFTAAATAAVVYGALAVYFFVLGDSPRPSTSPESAAPRQDAGAERIRPATPKEMKALLERGSSSAASGPSSSPLSKTSPGSPPPRQPKSWTHPDYVRGARAFNSALEQYKEYQRTRQNPSVLPAIEKQCREAIRLFESLRDEAPEEVNIPALVTQCYRLIEDVRQSTLVAPSRPEKDELSDIVQEAAAPPPSAAAETYDLVLNPSWNNPHPDASPGVLSDFEELLRRVAVPQADLSADTSIVIFGQIFYLMPVGEAARIMGKPQGIRRRIVTPGFPKDSFFYYTQSGNFGNGFDTLILITDSADRVAAVQLGSEKSQNDTWLDPSSFGTEWSVYNFVEGKVKGSVKWKIAHRVEKKNRVVEIDSELVSHDANGYFQIGESKSRAALFMPEPVANLILYRINTLKNNLRPSAP